MGLFKKAFKKAKGKSIARKASGKMGKGLVGKIRSKALRKLKNQSGKARTPSSGGIFGALQKVSKEKSQARKPKQPLMPARERGRGRGVSGSNQRKVAMYKGGGDIVAGASQQRRAAQGAEVVKSGVRKFAMGGAGKSGVRKFAMGGAGKSGIKKLGRGGKLKK